MCHNSRRGIANSTRTDRAPAGRGRRAAARLARPAGTPATQGHAAHAGHDGGHANFRGGVAVDHAPTASTRTRSCATSTGARRAGCRAGACCASGSSTRVDKEIEIAPGVKFAAWTYNGRIPGPTLRAREGERLRITFVNGSAHPHTIHFHGIHPAEMDGVPGLGAGEIEPGGAHRLRVRRAARRAAPLPLPRPAAGRAHRQGPLRRVHHRPEGRRARTPTSS